MFFDSPETKTTIRKAISILEDFNSRNATQFERSRNDFIKLILGTMKDNSESWDKGTSLNQEWNSGYLTAKLLELNKETSKDDLDDIYAVCFGFLQEYYLSIKSDLRRGYEKARKFGIENLDKFSTESQQKIIYVVHELPTALLKDFLNNSDIESIKDFNKFRIEADAKKKLWDEELNKAEKRVEILKDNLKEYESTYNFVGLNQGFKNLAEAKAKEKDALVKWLILFGFLILAPIAIELCFLYKSKDISDSFQAVIFASLIPMTSLVVIFIYYFRILLFNYKALKSQLLQLELRMTLCQFIQSYATYSQEIKEKDKGSLEKFENMIFSGLVSDESKLPTTFDGIEGLTNFIKSIKS